MHFLKIKLQTTIQWLRFNYNTKNSLQKGKVTNYTKNHIFDLRLTFGQLLIFGQTV